MICAQAKQMAKEIEVIIWTHKSVGAFDEDKFKEETSYEHYTCHLNAEDMPLKWNEAAPCIGKRAVSMHLVPQSETILKIARHPVDRALGACAQLSRAYSESVCACVRWSISVHGATRGVDWSNLGLSRFHG